MTHTLHTRMLLAAFALTLGLASVAAFASSAHAAAGVATNVSTGATSTSIQEVIDLASTTDGHIISVGDGTYDENVSIDKNITLRSENGSGSTTIEPASGRAIELLGQHNNLANITIEGFTLSTGGSDQIVLQANSQVDDGYDYQNLLYRDLVIEAGGDNFGIGLFDVDDVQIQNVTIKDATNAIEALGLKGLNITNSMFTGASGVGINVFAADGYEANTDLSIADSTFSDNTQAVNISDTDTIEISENDISGGYLGVTLQTVENATVSGNTINGLSAGTGNNATGIFLNNGVNNVTIAQNELSNITSSGDSDSSSQGILVGDSESDAAHGVVAIIGNTIENISGNPGAFGIMVNFETGNLTVENNTFANITGEKWMAGIGLDAPTPGATIEGNRFSGLSAGTYPEVAVNVNLREGNTADPAAVTVTHNNFLLPNDQFGASYDIGVEIPLGTLNAVENYWNALGGPGSVASGTGAMVTEHVTYEPWLCGPFESTSETSDEDGCAEDSGGDNSRRDGSGVSISLSDNDDSGGSGGGGGSDSDENDENEEDAEGEVLGVATSTATSTEALRERVATLIESSNTLLALVASMDADERAEMNGDIRAFLATLLQVLETMSEQLEEDA